MRSLLPCVALLLAGISPGAAGADSGAITPPPQCLSPCELAAGNCEEPEVDAMPDFDSALSRIESCPDGLLYAVEGACADGTRILQTGTGYTSEIKFYNPAGSFQGLLTKTDVIVPPCMGQGFWPGYVHCDAPQVRRNICGDFFDANEAAFNNAWE